ncbi:hypothetical protein QBC37DRAFT_423291 [Rhypophila decipiens]|uniref:Uncharacterized protein n=1 Tax=Rhypophila decipiens TaxID=261697 RepID=A0AAN6Y6V2_9PEZI|nr:hypothetical protein QBC37DRAFT_423291 [Rhypophila decipiens]
MGVVEALLTRDDLHINRRNRKGQHPVCFAAEYGAWDVVDLLNDERLVTTLGDRRFIEERRPRQQRTPELQPNNVVARVQPPLTIPSVAQHVPQEIPPYTPEIVLYYPQQAAVDWATFIQVTYQPEEEDRRHLRARYRGPVPPSTTPVQAYGAAEPATWPSDEEELNLFISDYLPLLENRDSSGNTLLAHIAMKGWESTLSLLMDKRHIFVNEANAEGLTPLMLALRLRHNGIARDLLMRNDLVLNTRDRMGHTALAYTTDRGMASLLKSCGATY